MENKGVYEVLVERLKDRTNDNTLKWVKLAPNGKDPIYLCKTKSGMKVSCLKIKQKAQFDSSNETDGYFVLVEDSKGAICSVVEGRKGTHIEPKIKQLYTILDNQKLTERSFSSEERLKNSINLLSGAY